jgi:hypothetical protein
MITAMLRAAPAVQREFSSARPEARRAVVPRERLAAAFYFGDADRL